MAKKNDKKGVWLTITGGISAALGGIGAAFSALGLCACVLYPIFSFAGLIVIVTGFLADYNVYFITIGVFLLVAGFITHRKKKVCKRHKKK